MVRESNQNVFLIQIDALSFAEFEISEFQISRFDCCLFSKLHTSNAVTDVAIPQVDACGIVQAWIALALVDLVLAVDTMETHLTFALVLGNPIRADSTILARLAVAFVNLRLAH